MDGGILPMPCFQRTGREGAVLCMVVQKKWWGLHESHRNGYSGYSGYSGLEKILSHVGNTTAIITVGRCYPAGCLLID